MLYLSFIIANDVYAVPVEYVEESIQFSSITRIPRMPHYVQGVMNLRGKIVPVYDARLRMGMPSKQKERTELINLLKQREKEHVNWLNTLENEVNEGKHISVQRDPAKCNFGKWYGPFLKKLVDEQAATGSVDNLLLGLLKKFDEPHKQIHGLANRAEELISSQNVEGAKNLIEQAKKTTLASMISLFSDTCSAIEEQKKRDIILILNHKGNQFGVNVDSVNSTIELNDFQNTNLENEIIESISIEGKNTVQIMNLEAFSEVKKAS